MRQTVNRFAGFGLVVNDPKSRSSRRKIVLADLTIQALQQYRKRQEQERVQAGDGWIDQGLVFTDIHGDS